MFNRLRNSITILILISVFLSACAATPSANPTTATASSTTHTTQPPVVEGGEGGVETAPVTYSDAQQGFSIGHPGSWTQDKTFTNGVKFIGGDDSMTLEFIALPSGTDVMSFAKNDVPVVTNAFPGFTQIRLAASTEVKNAIVLGFSANGTSTVTAKAYNARGDRYYMPLADGRIAVLTVVGPDNHYDREGVRDIALTFKVTK